MGFWNGVLGAILYVVEVNEKPKREARRQEEEAAAQEYKNYCLTCRKCSRLAEPLPGTPNRYRCSGCGNQFAGARHPY